MYLSQRESIYVLKEKEISENSISITLEGHTHQKENHSKTNPGLLTGQLTPFQMQELQQLHKEQLPPLDCKTKSYHKLNIEETRNHQILNSIFPQDSIIPLDLPSLLTPLCTNRRTSSLHSLCLTNRLFSSWILFRSLD